MGKRPPSPTSCADIELGLHARASHQTPYPPQPQQLWISWLVPVFFLINIMTFVFTMYFNDCPSDAGAGYCILSSTLGRFSFEPLSVNPLLGPSLQTLDDMGALDWKKVVYEGEGWRLMSCIWLHAGVIHLLANMLSLLFIGIRLEQEFGFCKAMCWGCYSCTYPNFQEFSSCCNLLASCNEKSKERKGEKA